VGKLLSSFKKIDGLNNLFAAERGALRCSAVRLTTGGLCLFSPVLGLGDEAISSLAALGDVEFLLAPNHYHNKALKEYQQAFPKASICAPREAQSRLEKVTGLKFTGLTSLQTSLPENMHLIVTQGLKTGEVWLRIVDTPHTAWLVVDAFSGPKGKQLNVASEPEMLGTFPKFGVADRIRYLEWVEEQIKVDTPTMIVPCHGGIICNSKMSKSLRHLLQSNL